ncbi:antitoxin MqsA [bacterium BMS3Abin10]|nr:antitoxin MqsA [bacterium BMS3Abin10]
MENTCPICGAEALEKRSTTETLEYKGRKITIPNYISYKCNECEESIVDEKTIKSSSKILNEFKKEVDGLLPIGEIKRIRNSLGFTQEQISTILGGGKKAFAKYESGRIIQSKAMDNLLRIIGEYPFVINIISKQSRVKKTKITNVIDLREYKAKKYKMKSTGYTVATRDREKGVSWN